MQKHTKVICVLATFQILCLAFGLWIHDRILIHTATWDNRQATLQGVSEQRAVPSKPPTPTSDAKAFESLKNSMPVARFLTLIWIGGLQFVAMFLVISRFRTDTSKNEKQSQIELLRREKDLLRTRNAVIFGLASLAESRDRETGQHLERIALYSTRLAAAMRDDRRFHGQISSQFLKAIGISAVLHDIGKVGVPDAILLKPGGLSEIERRRMQEHTVIGSECLKQIEARLGNSNFLQMARQIALYHHERWDGEGYPKHLSGDTIPLVARIVALADIYDALSVKRVYKEAYPHEECVSIIRAEAGKHLDPAIVDVFLKIEDDFRTIADQFANAADMPVPFVSEPSSTIPLPLGVETPEDQLMDSMFEFEETIEQALVGA
jgi:HD-GYP domain-containing protein (c-di-GMP phosphodiesterase class II)